MLRGEAALFAEVTFQIWDTVGWLGFITSLFQSAVLTPQQRTEREPPKHSKNRPIFLISVLTKMTVTALTKEINNAYRPQNLHWGHRRNISTQCAVCRGVCSKDATEKYTTILFIRLQESYDMVRRVKLRKWYPADCQLA